VSGSVCLDTGERQVAEATAPDPDEEAVYLNDRAEHAHCEPVLFPLRRE
jgi:hypothetical protein